MTRCLQGDTIYGLHHGPGAVAALPAVGCTAAARPLPFRLISRVKSAETGPGPRSSACTPALLVPARPGPRRAGSPATADGDRL
jgi:hypothetical protein